MVVQEVLDTIQLTMALQTLGLEVVVVDSMETMTEHLGQVAVVS